MRNCKTICEREKTRFSKIAGAIHKKKQQRKPSWDKKQTNTILPLSCSELNEMTTAAERVVDPCS